MGNYLTKQMHSDGKERRSFLALLFAAGDLNVRCQQMVENIILFPFRLLWNLIVTGLIVTGFVLWYGFIFGSVLGVILILIFAPDLFLLPLLLASIYTKMWNE